MTPDALKELFPNASTSLIQSNTRPAVRPAISFFVAGKPAPGGSKNFFPVRRKDGGLVTRTTSGGFTMPVIRVVDAGGKGNEIWKQVVAMEGRKVMGSAKPLTGPLSFTVAFSVPRPLAHFRGEKAGNPLKEDAPAYPAFMPDALKLTRSTEDALTGILWEDDSQNVAIAISKRYANEFVKMGCLISVRKL